MNKQEAVSQIMEIKAVLPEHLQAKLIEAVRVLATFKMISAEKDLPYWHPHLVTKLTEYSKTPLCIVNTEKAFPHIDYMTTSGYGYWRWQMNSNYYNGAVTNWLPLSALIGPHIMDELCNELKFE